MLIVNGYGCSVGLDSLVCLAVNYTHPVDVLLHVRRQVSEALDVLASYQYPVERTLDVLASLGYDGM